MQPRFPAAACISAALLLTGCESAICSCDSGILLLLPCPEAAAQVTSVETTGACQGAAIEGEGSQSIWIWPTKVGACQVALHFKDGSTFSREMTIRHTQGCCAGYRSDQGSFIEVPMAPACPVSPDAGAIGCGDSNPKGRYSACLATTKQSDCEAAGGARVRPKGFSAMMALGG